LGYRLELENKIVAYCVGTGFCRSIHELSENADLLITESSILARQVEGKLNVHLRPEDAASIAAEAGVGRLVLTHFGANVYKSPEDRILSETTAKKIFRKTIAAFDGLEIEI
jgi:ribonuclease Z